MAFQGIGPGFPEDLPEPPAGFHPWDGDNANHAGFIRVLEFQIRQQVANLGGGDHLVGMQNIRERVTHSRQELSAAVNPATPFLNDAARREEMNRLCNTVSRLEHVVPAPDAVVPENDRNAHVHHFRLHLNGERLGPLDQLTHLVKAREQVTSGRHTMRGVNYDAVEENQEQPEWTVFYNGREDVLRNAHASHDEYREAFDMGPHVDPFHWQQPEPLIPITEFVAGARSASGGAHNTEKWREPPAPMVVPNNAPALPHPWVDDEGEMPLLNSFGRHVDQYHVTHPWTMLIMQVSVVRDSFFVHVLNTLVLLTVRVRYQDEVLHNADRQRRKSQPERALRVNRSLHV